MGEDIGDFLRRVLSEWMTGTPRAGDDVKKLTDLAAMLDDWGMETLRDHLNHWCE